MSRLDWDSINFAEARLAGGKTLIYAVCSTLSMVAKRWWSTCTMLNYEEHQERMSHPDLGCRQRLCQNGYEPIRELHSILIAPRKTPFGGARQEGIIKQNASLTPPNSSSAMLQTRHFSASQSLNHALKMACNFWRERCWPSHSKTHSRWGLAINLSIFSALYHTIKIWQTAWWHSGQIRYNVDAALGVSGLTIHHSWCRNRLLQSCSWCMRLVGRLVALQPSPI